MAARDLASSSSRTRVAGPTRSGPLVPPALAARYRSLFVLGRGGMGTVEAALEVGDADADRAGYQRVVALKRLLPDSARDTRRVEMFMREARLAAMLDHPNVVRAFDYGEIDGELFLALEYIEGQPLSRVLRALAEAKGTLDVTLAAHVLAEVCEGLHAAHELKDEAGQPLALVHRDVSPQNVMLSYDGHVRLLDFGVAKIEAESVTKTGEVKGKTAYMSPEQAMGDDIDRRSDLFGVGAVLYECLTLQRMWGDGTDMDVIRKLALERPPRLEDALPGAPTDLYALYTRLVGREAQDRPASAHDVAVALRRLVPQGAEAAAKSLRALLETHFGAQALEQHRRLTLSLEEVAPEQARELRESVSPENPEQLAKSSTSRLRESPPPGAPTRRPHEARASSASIADATGENAAVTAEAPGVTGIAGASRAAKRWPWLLVATLAVVAVVTWRATATPTDGKFPIAPLASTASGPSSAIAPASAVTPVSPASASAVAIASGTTTAPATSPPLPRAAGSGAASAPPASARVLAQSSLRPPPATSAPPSASAPRTAPPPPSAKPPPDVDDHPF